MGRDSKFPGDKRILLAALAIRTIMDNLRSLESIASAVSPQDQDCSTGALSVAIFTGKFDTPHGVIRRIFMYSVDRMLSYVCTCIKINAPFLKTSHTFQ